MIKPTSKLGTLSIFALMTALPAVAIAIPQPITVCYVDRLASGNNTGTSWANAYDGILGVQSALADDTCTQIWVAKGLYIPGEDREDTFQLKNGVALYGGFEGAEVSLSARDIIENETFLSGELGEFGNYADNVYHVVTGSGTDKTAVLDGFTVERGNADGPSPDNKGGGMYTNSGSPTVRNVTFLINIAGSGGGMYSNNSSSEISGVLFRDNFADHGAGMYNGMSNVTVTNASFWQNQAISGAAIYNAYSNAVLTNLTIYYNLAQNSGGGIFNEYSSPTVDNTILWDNQAKVEGSNEVYNDENSDPTVRNSVVEGGYDAGTNIIVNDPLLEGLGDYGGRMRTIGIAHNSPAIDRSTTNCALVDQRGLSRNTLGDRCDIGAYEFVPVLHVSSFGRTDGFCQSWSFACDLQYALKSSLTGQDVWVEAGIYTPTGDADRKIYFELKELVDVYGGFAGTEDDFSLRDPKNNITILSGEIGVQGDPTDNSLHVVKAENISQSTHLDGFTISDGYADDETENSGGGLVCLDSDLILDRVEFRNNYAIEDGGGMFVRGEGSAAFYSELMLRDVAFRGNTTAGYGGGLYIFEGSATLSRVSFIDNQAKDGGGGMSMLRNQAPFTKSRTVIKNSTFSGNTAKTFLAMGGAIDIGLSMDVSILFSTFNNNSSDMGGAVHVSVDSTANISQNIFWGNSAATSEPEIRYKGDSDIVHNSVIEGGFASGTDIITEDPQLGSLGDHGGYFESISLLAGSSAIDIVTPEADYAGFGKGCVEDHRIFADQRGVTRPQGLACDLGAFEVEQAPAVFSVLRYGASPTSDQIVYFLVVFTEEVTGADETDFALWSSGSITGASIRSTSDIYSDQYTYLVEVNMGSGSGFVGLDVKGSGTGIQDLDGNNLVGGFTGGEFYATTELDGPIFSNGFE